MRPSFHPRLINDPFGDPGVFIPFLFEKRALMFDLGDVHLLSSRDLLKVTHVFVTHTHMDHFIGFDELIRVILGREKTLHIFGPHGFLAQVEGKLAGYSWNLVNEYHTEFTLRVHEVRSDRILTASYHCREGFQPRGSPLTKAFNGLLLKEPAFSVRGVLLDHRVPCLGFSLEENFYLNILKDRLKELGLPVGPWLNSFKQAVYRGEDPEAKFSVQWKDGGGTVCEKHFLLADLAEKIAKISPGQKITYIADAIGSAENQRRIIDLAQGSDLLYIEAGFLDSERNIAKKKYHLTAWEAGELAGKAGVKDFKIFHYSPRYKNQSEALEQEAREAYKKALMPGGRAALREHQPLRM